MDLWQFPRPDQGRIDTRNRILAGVGVSLLVLWAAALATYFVAFMVALSQTDPERRVGGVGLFLALLCGQSILCGLVLLAASFAPSVRAVRALRWLVVVGLVLAWLVPVIGFLGILD